MRLPSKTKGCTVVDANGDFNIYINSELCSDCQTDAFLHEIRHIEMGHFYNLHAVTDDEDEADKK
jgi:hypothetical protein